MSKGSAAPQAARTPATVAGISWIDAVLSTIKRQRLSEAVPPQPLAMRLAAWMPRGVAALPMPSRFAEILAEIAESVTGSPAASGNNFRSSGRKAAARICDRPLRSMISKTPLHRQITPSSPTHNVTASLAPERAAALTASMVPLYMPNSTETATIAVKIHAIAIKPPRKTIVIATDFMISYR